MATDINLLQGEVTQDPENQHPKDSDIERLLAGFLRALLDEQREKSQGDQS